MEPTGSILPPAREAHPAPKLPDHKHVVSKMGPTSPPSGSIRPPPQPDDSKLSAPGPEPGHHLKHPESQNAGAMDDGVPDDNYYYIDDCMEDFFAEDLEHYKQGGFHPVNLGDRLGPSGCYRVVSKLGFGGFGTVWLCRDTLRGKWRAVKIERAYDKKKPVRNAYRELMIKQHLDLTFDGDLADHHIGIPSEYFWISGPNGHHLCAVMPVLGPPLHWVNAYYGLHPSVLKDICFQLAQSLKFLHSHGICHGDYRPDNILFQLADDIDNWSEEDMTKALGPPTTIEIHFEGPHPRDPGIPAHLVSPQSFDFSSGICSTKISVIDFGVAYHVETPPKFSGIPIPFAAPEEALHVGQYYPVGFSSDIWSLACTMSVVRSGYSIFGEQRLGEQLIAEVECLVGPVPHPYRLAWVERWNPQNAKFWHASIENDETIPITHRSRVWAERKKLEVEGVLTSRDGVLVKDQLLFPFVNGTHHLYIDAAQAEEIARGFTQDTTRLPGFTPEDEDVGAMLRFERRVVVPVDFDDATMFCDLLRSIFKWDPRQRANIDMVMRHPWFEGRGRRNRFCCVVM